MIRAIFLPLILLLTACSADRIPPQQRIDTIEGNRLQVTSGLSDKGRYVSVENLDRQWQGKWQGGKEKWGARKKLFDVLYKREIERVCGIVFHQTLRDAEYKMMDKDETLGGVAPVLGVAASMAAYAAAYSNTDERNIPISVYTEFRCPNDKEQ